MKKTLLLLFILSVCTGFAKAQTTNDILNVLIQKNLVSQKDADSIRAEAAITTQNDLSKMKFFPVNAGRKIQISGYTQIRYQLQEEKGKVDGFDIRRARIDLKGTISPFWAYRIQFDLAATPKLLDAYAELKLNNYLNFTIGQAKIPFSLENLVSSNKLELIDRSQVVEALVARGKDVIGNHNGRDLGIQVAGSILTVQDRTVLDYRLGLFNGSGINLADKNEGKDMAARLVFHPITGLDFSGAYYNGSIYLSDTDTKSNRDRYGFDLSYDFHDLAFRGEYIHGKDGLKERQGYYLMAGYSLFQKKLQLLAKYDFYDPEKDKADDASTWFVLGANLNLNASTRFQVNYTIKEEEGVSIRNNYASFQLQIGF